MADHRIRPHRRHQVIFAEDLAIVLNQVNQRVENLWRKRYRFAGTKQQPLGDVQAEVPEGIDVRFLRIHSAFKNFQKLS